MVNKETLKTYNYETINDYFLYIIESKINGQNRQVADLIEELSKNQKKEFLFYLLYSCDNLDKKSVTYCTDITIKLL